MNCAICFEKLRKNTPKLSCSHSFHVKCLRKWYYIGQKSNCPLCRAGIQIVSAYKILEKTLHNLFNY